MRLAAWAVIAGAYTSLGWTTALDTEPSAICCTAIALFLVLSSRTQKYNEVETNIHKIREYVNTNTEPERDIDLYCQDPYDCAYYGYCETHTGAVCI